MSNECLPWHLVQDRPDWESSNLHFLLRNFFKQFVDRKKAAKMLVKGCLSGTRCDLWTQINFFMYSFSQIKSSFDKLIIKYLEYINSLLSTYIARAYTQWSLSFSSCPSFSYTQRTRHPGILALVIGQQTEWLLTKNNWAVKHLYVLLNLR